MARQVEDVFLALDAAVLRGELITRSGSRDKEFHFQDWCAERLTNAAVLHDQQGRNTYPDLTLVHSAEGFEIKGLGWPGREADYDCNSQVPVGVHNGRDVYYVFGRYPAKPIEDEYPVIDLVVCHGSLLNAVTEYAHKNRSIRAFGSYGDILLRDRKMYVAPTPFALLEGTTGQRTLILPSDAEQDKRLQPVGDFTRVEVEQLMAAYRFDLVENELRPEFMPNPNAGFEHRFTAFRPSDSIGPEVKLRASPPLPPESVFDEEEDE